MKLNKIFLLNICLVLFIIFISTEDIYAYELVNKEKLIYEVNSVLLNEEGISMSGWSFIGESQHYSNPNDFSGAIILDNGVDLLEYPLNFHKKDMTDLMKMGNPRKCNNNEYNQLARNCYYDYSMIGWNIFIPIEDLKNDSIYNVSLKMKAKKSGQEYTTRVIFSADHQVVNDIERDRIVSINSAINNTRIAVNHDFVLVRKNPSKSSEVYYSDKNCSLEYGNAQYFIKYTEYLRVKDYVSIDDITWYQIGVEEIGCYASKASVIEGELLAWIPSTYVNYNGSIATITTKSATNIPIIYLENQTIYVGDTSFNPDIYVSAYDKYDGPLVPKRRSSTLNINKVGRYAIMYSATNSKNKTALKTMYVDVIEKNINLPPKLYAYDQTLYINDVYNPLNNVSALDNEEGDISDRVELLNTVNTNKAGIFNQCYYVEDMDGLSDEKCVLITVLPNIISPIYHHNSLRFIDINNPFYKESIPNVWLSLQSILLNKIKSKTTLRSIYY